MTNKAIVGNMAFCFAPKYICKISESGFWCKKGYCTNNLVKYFTPQKIMKKGAENDAQEIDELRILISYENKSKCSENDQKIRNNKEL